MVLYSEFTPIVSLGNTVYSISKLGERYVNPPPPRRSLQPLTSSNQVLCSELNSTRSLELAFSILTVLFTLVEAYMLLIVCVR